MVTGSCHWRAEAWFLRWSPTPAAPRTLVFEHERHVAIRRGDWKLVASDALSHDGLRPGVRWELYDVASDPTEQHDLAATRPRLADDLAAEFLQEAKRTLILPRP